MRLQGGLAGLGPSPGDPEHVPSTPRELGWILGHSGCPSAVRWYGGDPTHVLELGPFEYPSQQSLGASRLLDQTGNGWRLPWTPRVPGGAQRVYGNSVWEPLLRGGSNPGIRSVTPSRRTNEQHKLSCAGPLTRGFCSVRTFEICVEMYDN